jgi:hypothetical protein
MLRRVVSTLALAVAPLGAAAAQSTSISTGVGALGGFDASWEVACRTLTVGSSSSSCDAAGSATRTYHDAALVTVMPSGWATVGGASGGAYISRVADASLRPSAGNELANFEYSYRTSFDIGANDPNQYLVELTRMRFDNYWTGYRLNGGELQVAGVTDSEGAAPGDVGTANWTRDFSLTIDQGFKAGVNTLELVFSGNGINDGLYVEGTIQSLTGGAAATVTPEPSTYLLTASGLIALVAASRRRRNV